jgi:hypothetical protein
MNSPDQDGLRQRNTSTVVRKFDIEVRTRPISGYGGAMATHAFIVLLEGYTVVDSLSFDPSNSIGLEDGDPGNDSRGRAVVGTDVQMETWSELKDAFQRAANSPYDLRNHNCTHAVSIALTSGPWLPGAMDGVRLVHDANKAWDTANGRLSADDFYGKNK